MLPPGRSFCVPPYNAWTTLQDSQISPIGCRRAHAGNVEDVIEAHERYRANIVEMGLNNMSQELFNVCRELGIKIMIYHQEKDPEAFREVIRWGVDMINLNHGDVFAEVAREFREQQL